MKRGYRCYWKEGHLRPAVVCVGVLGFMQERFHNPSPGDFEGVFIRAGDRESRKGLREKKQQEGD